jgi:hypothetical protein
MLAARTRRRPPRTFEDAVKILEGPTLKEAQGLSASPR